MFDISCMNAFLYVKITMWNKTFFICHKSIQWNVNYYLLLQKEYIQLGESFNASLNFITNYLFEISPCFLEKPRTYISCRIKDFESQMSAHIWKFMISSNDGIVLTTSDTEFATPFWQLNFSSHQYWKEKMSFLREISLCYNLESNRNHILLGTLN